MQSTLGFYFAIPFKMKESLQNAFQGNSFWVFFALIRVTLYPHASQYVSTMFMVDEDGCNAISCVFTTSSCGSRFDILWVAVAFLLLALLACVPLYWYLPFKLNRDKMI